VRRSIVGIVLFACVAGVSAGEIGFGIVINGQSLGWTIRGVDNNVEVGVVVRDTARWYAAALGKDGRVAAGGMFGKDVRPYAALRGSGSDGYVGVETDLWSVWGVGVLLTKEEEGIPTVVEEKEEEKCEKYDHPPPCI